MKTVYLIYRPVMDYEESMDPHFICLTEKAAKRVEKEMCDYATALAAQMPEYTREMEEDDEDCSKYSEIDAKRRELRQNAQWPYGIDLSGDFNGFYEIEFNPSCVAIMPLQVIS